MRAFGLLALTLTVLGVNAGCKKAEEPPPPPPPAPPPAQAASKPASQPAEPAKPPPPVTPSADAPDPVSPYTLAALTPGALCRYEFTEVMSEQMGGDKYAGREMTVQYVLRAKPATKKAPIVFEAEVEHVAVAGRRAGVKYELDSQRPADLQRVRGGADTTVEPQLVVYFALLNEKVTIELDGRGVLKNVGGSEAIRNKFLSYHPPAPRKGAHYIAKTKVRLSDEAIAALFLPYSTAMFAEGAIEDGRQDKEAIDFLHPDHRANAVRGRRVVASGKRIMLQTKWQFGPAKKKHTVPKQVDEPLQAFEGGDGGGLVAFEAKNPCFLQGAQTWNLNHIWKGLIEGEPVTTKRLRTETLIWRKQATPTR